jgi:hypothetical protein
MSSSVTARAAGLLSLLAALALVLPACGGGSAEAPSLDDPRAEATALLEGFFTALQQEDVDALDELLAPAFQVVRANGTVQDKPAYLADLPDLGEFSLDSVQATVGEDELVVSYLLTVSESVEGTSQPVGPAPRLSVFEWRDGAWRLVAHANFGAIER